MDEKMVQEPFESEVVLEEVSLETENDLADSIENDAVETMGVEVETAAREHAEKEAEDAFASPLYTEEKEAIVAEDVAAEEPVAQQTEEVKEEASEIVKEPAEEKASDEDALKKAIEEEAKKVKKKVDKKKKIAEKKAKEVKEKVHDKVEQEKKGLKLKARLLIMSILPLILLSATIIFISSFAIEKIATEEAIKGLKGIAVSMTDTFNEQDAGKYQLRGNQLFKGKTNVSSQLGVVENIKEENGYESTVFYGDTRFLTSLRKEDGNYAVGTKASEEVVEEVINKGHTLIDENIEILGKKYVGYYKPIYNYGSEEPIGMLFVGTLRNDIDKEITNIRRSIFALSAGCMVVFIIVVLIILNSIVRAIEHGVGMLTSVANGDLTIGLSKKLTNRTDEIGSLGRSISGLKEQLVEIVKGIQDESEQLAEASDHMKQRMIETTDNVNQVERAVEEIASGAGSQAEETQNATENVIFMGNMVEETAEEVEVLLKNANAMLEEGQNAAETLQELNKINAKTKKSIDVIYEQTNITNQSVLKIREATNLITAIADETNLLSLNASIEAARAGEQGRGFAVVAAQIQKLAEQSNDSAMRIEEIIKSLIQDSEKAVDTMDDVKKIMNEQISYVEHTDAIVKNVLEGVKESAKGITKISEMTEKLDSARSQVVDTVQNLTAIAEENAASTEETSASTTEVTNAINAITEQSEKVADISEEIHNKVSYFKV